MTLVLVRGRENPDAPPMVVEYSTTMAVFRCRVPVIPSGDGAADPPLPLSERTARCGHPTTAFAGLIPTCLHHLQVVWPMLCVTEQEVRDSLRRSGESQPMPCLEKAISSNPE